MFYYKTCVMLVPHIKEKMPMNIACNMAVKCRCRSTQTGIEDAVDFWLQTAVNFGRSKRVWSERGQGKIKVAAYLHHFLLIFLNKFV